MRSTLVLLVLALLPAATQAVPEPDLQPEIYGVVFQDDMTVGAGDVAEGCAGGTDGRLLLRFGVRFYNVGDAALVIGDPGCPVCADNPGAVCEDPRFICSPADGHNHPHFIGFANYELRDWQGNVIRQGGKKSFCVRDNRCGDGVTPVFDCSNQGISSGCLDDYDPSLGCQYIDVTGVPDVTTRALRLRATLDPDALLPDADRTNNAVEFDIPGCGDGIVQAGEECDPGAPNPLLCCDAQCRIVANTPCDQPPGPCGSAGGAFPDGTACGPGAPPCMLQVCQAGVCTTRPGSGGCLIGATCFAPGTDDPVDACQLCDPARREDTWSSDVAPDPAGLRCQLDRVFGALVGKTCRPRVTRRLGRPLGRIDALVDRLQTASGSLANRLGRRLDRQMVRLTNAERRALDSGCDLGTFPREVDTMTAQFHAYRGLRPN
ncbi:MAG TPA: lysyl oxidase family protein [Candidatus Binatia bacterium]|nr:lysyl oxidase family protein [Candidatus Binatia bacterium]